MQTSTFMLVDNGMLGGQANFAGVGDAWPRWLVPIYKGKASAAGPLVVDLEAAYEDDQIDQTMAMANALKPALHVSFIDTAMSLDDLVQHLKQFIFIVHEDGKQQTLRFADCAVLPHLVSVLDPAQWTTLAGPFVRWRVHDRSGLLQMLPNVGSEMTRAPFPLQLRKHQINELNDAMEPDHLLANLEVKRFASQLPGTAKERYEWVSAAYSMWRTEGDVDHRAIKPLAEAALATQGEILRRRALRSLLACGDPATFKERLLELVAAIEERQAYLKDSSKQEIANDH